MAIDLKAWAQTIQFAEDTEEVKSVIDAIGKVTSPSDRIDIRNHVIMALWLDGAEQRKKIQVLENDLRIARTGVENYRSRLSRIEDRVKDLLK